jgi:DNA-binding protein YbaB
MKIAAFALTTLAALASASEYNLRAAPNTLIGTKSSDPAEARVMVHGLLHDTSTEDLNIINKSVVAAYNSAYSATGYSFTSMKTTTSVSIPDKVGFWPGCRWCSEKDDALTATNTQAQLVFVEIIPDKVDKVGFWPGCRFFCGDDDALNAANIHNKFEEDFCGLLRSSGSVNLAGANECSLSFLETPGHTASVPTESVYTSNSGEATEAQVIMQGTLHDFSENDFAVIDKSIVSAYNDAFTKAGYTTSSFEVLAETDMPVPVGFWPGCRWCSDEEEDAVTMENESKMATMVFARFWPGCRWCGDDAVILNDAPILKDSQIAFMHEAFEKAFCTKLQNSGLANFANVHDCSFHFVSSPTGGADAAQQ